MELKKRTLEFSFSMFAFYFLSSSLVNWFNGLAFDDLVFYLAIMALSLFSLLCIIKIILEPHIVKNKDTDAPFVLLVFGVLIVFLLVPGLEDIEDCLLFAYFLSTIISMSVLIKWYKVTGVELEDKPIEDKVFVDKPKENDLTDLEQLEVEIREALNVTPTGTDAYRHLIHSEQLVKEIIADKIEYPKNIITQMTAVVDHYKDLVSRRIKTAKIVNTLYKLEGTLKMVEDTLIQIYDAGIDSQINEIETDSETFEKLVELEGLKESDFKLDK